MSNFQIPGFRRYDRTFVPVEIPKEHMAARHLRHDRYVRSCESMSYLWPDDLDRLSTGDHAAPIRDVYRGTDEDFPVDTLEGGSLLTRSDGYGGIYLVHLGVARHNPAPWGRKYIIIAHAV